MEADKISASAAALNNKYIKPYLYCYFLFLSVIHNRMKREASTLFWG
jgi:hypothetical protein